MDPQRRLLTPTIALIVAHIVHDFDHVRQGRLIEVPVIVLGGLAYVLVFGVLLLVLRRHPAAPAGAIMVGLVTALGFVAVHVIPDWGPLADGYPVSGVDVWSWGMVFADIAVAGWLAIAGLLVTRHQALVREEPRSAGSAAARQSP